MGTQELLAKESIGKLLLKYSVPAIIGMIVNALYNVYILFLNQYLVLIGQIYIVVVAYHISLYTFLPT